MMGSKDMTMANEKQRRLGLGWPIAIFMGTAMLAGVFAGYNKAAAEAGDTMLAPWVGPLIAIALGVSAMALYLRRHIDQWRQWSPRKRLYWISLFGSFGLGIMIAIMMQSGQQDVSNDMFSNSALTPTMAVVLSLMWVIGLGVAMILYHRSIDDHERHAYRLGAAAGFYAFVVPCPVWWVLARAGMAPPVEAMSLFLFSLIVNCGVYLWFKFR